MRSYIGNGRGGEWFSGNVKIANRVKGAQRGWKEREEVESNSFIRNVGSYLPVNKTFHTRILQSSTTPLRELRISQYVSLCDPTILRAHFHI